MGSEDVAGVDLTGLVDCGTTGLYLENTTSHGLDLICFRGLTVTVSISGPTQHDAIQRRPTSKVSRVCLMRSTTSRGKSISGQAHRRHVAMVLMMVERPGVFPHDVRNHVAACGHAPVCL